ncbi:MAG: ROK family transcriptional regulator [Actinomycetaceae bacterium]|nr:ROK family transcriptional regulator [Actinomycetaceae bacterium]
MNYDYSSGPGSPSSLRHANQRRILATLIDAGGLSQAEIARRTGLAPATVSNIVRELSTAGILQLTAEAAGRRGRVIRFAAGIGYAAGISLERKSVRVGLATLDHTVIGTRTRELPPGYAPDLGLRTAREVLDELRDELDVSKAQTVACCLTLATMLSPDGQVLSSQHALAGWSNTPLASMAEQAFEQEVLVENDANAGVLAEHTWGRAQDVNNVLYVHISNGIGAGIMIDGKVLKGMSGTAGEIGHLAVPTSSQQCLCGNTGCLETAASVPAVLGTLASLGQPADSVTEIVTRIQSGDALCQRLIIDMGLTLGHALAAVVNTINPSMIIIGGEGALAGDYLLTPTRTALERLTVPGSCEKLVVTTSSLGAEAPLHGALAMGVNSVDLDAILQGV